jgi:sortase (surface protein transpeptidase)
MPWRQTAKEWPGRIGLLGGLAVFGVGLVAAAAILAAAPTPAPLQLKPVILSTRLAPTPAATRLSVPTPLAVTSTPAAQALVDGAPYSPHETEPTATPTTPPRMLIPSLGLDEAVLTIPIIDGNWDLSQLDTQIGWLSTTGSHPGDALAMDFIGHYTVNAALKGALADLWKTQLEDEITYRSGGVDYVYAIKSKVTVAPNAVSQLYVNDGQQLLLVTCTDWNYLLFKYDDRLIVTANFVRQQPAP